MSPDELATRLQLLSAAPGSEKALLAQALSKDLASLSPSLLGELLCFSENALEPKCARTATRMLLKALETVGSAAEKLGASQLLRSGLSLPTLSQVARCVQLGDLPPGPELADELFALMLSFDPSCVTSMKGAGSANHVLLGAVRHLGLASQLPEAAAEALLRHAFRCEPRQRAGPLISEAGKLLPEWKPLLLRLLLSGDDDIPQVSSSSLVKLAQQWGAHEDPEIFERLRCLVRQGCDESGMQDVSSGKLQERELPRLRLENERVVLVAGDGVGEEALHTAVASAKQSIRQGGCLRVALDAEWEDPRPLSLLQLAIDNGHQESGCTVFLVDMLAPLSPETTHHVRWLLRGGTCCAEASDKAQHEVLVFGAQEDKRRLGASGVLPELLPPDQSLEEAKQLHDTATDALGWLDLQKIGKWQLGLQPSLRSVVAQELQAYLDKELQRSDWDRRPLSEAQKEYAALDASVLLRLRNRCKTLSLQPAEVELHKGASATTKSKPDLGRLSPEEEKEKWLKFRQTRRKMSSEVSEVCNGLSVGSSEGYPSVLTAKAALEQSSKRELNADLKFLLPSSLSKLMRKMRGLGLDTQLAEEGAPQRQLAQVALEEDRIILTRSRKMQLPGEAASRLYLLRCEGTDEQLREVIDIFEVEIDEDCLCGRCVQCNAWDWRFATREDVRGNPQIGEKTLAAYDEFWVCGGCGKIFWEGSMFEKAVAHFSTFLPDKS